MKEKATKEEMHQEALDRLEILVSYGVDERIIEHFERGILWSYDRHDDRGELIGMRPANPVDALRIKQIDNMSNGIYLTYCICNLFFEDDGERGYAPSMITVGNDKGKWIEEREYLLIACNLLKPCETEVVDNYARGILPSYDMIEMIESLGYPCFVSPSLWSDAA